MTVPAGRRRQQAARPARGRARALLAPCLAGLLLAGCYTQSALRHSEKMVTTGFDVETFGPWVILTGPGAAVLAGGNMLVGSLVPLRGGVDPREPAEAWFRAYPGRMRPGEEVAILCHAERSTWVTGIRVADAGGDWQSARHEKWHFPVCLEVLPGRYDLEVHYFARETEASSEESVSRQTESTEASQVLWEAEAGRVYLLSAVFGDVRPAQGRPPQRHIPRSRDLGTTWWGLEEADWYARIERAADWSALEGPVVEQRRAWRRYEGAR